MKTVSTRRGRYGVQPYRGPLGDIACRKRIQPRDVFVFGRVVGILFSMAMTSPSARHTERATAGLDAEVFRNFFVLAKASTAK